MVESLLGLGTLVLMFAGLILLHGYGARQIRALEEARLRAWRRSLEECAGDEPLFQQILQDIGAGEIPFPDNWLPHQIDDSASFSMSGLYGRGTESGSKAVAFVCNPRASTADPLSRPADWVLGMFL